MPCRAGGTGEGSARVCEGRRQAPGWGVCVCGGVRTPCPGRQFQDGPRPAEPPRPCARRPGGGGAPRGRAPCPGGAAPRAEATPAAACSVSGGPSPRDAGPERELPAVKSGRGAGGRGGRWV